jgi:hypothetical protein
MWSRQKGMIRMADYRRASRRLTFDDAVEIWVRWSTTSEFQNRIAAAFDVNPGRVNEVLKRKRFPDAYDVAMAKLKAVNDNEPPKARKSGQLTLV